ISTVVYADHESRGYWGGGQLNIRLDTVVLNAGMRHTLTDGFGLGYRLRATTIVEGYGEDLYVRGTRLKAAAFNGGSLAGIGTLLLNPEGRWRAELDLESGRAGFYTVAEGAKEPGLPPDFRQRVAQLRLIFEDTPGKEGHKLSLTLAQGERRGWRVWALDPAGKSRGRYQRFEGEAQGVRDWGGGHSSTAGVYGLFGKEVDLFSGFNVGGMAGAYSVAGYYRNEMRARAGWVLNLKHDAAFASDRVVTVMLDGARVTPQEQPWLAEEPARRYLSGYALGYRHGLRSLGGLPIILRYGQALRIPEGSPESQRREVALIVAAGF
ncbi:MAG: hypothetical protein OEW39_16835, partial [Deltaproteobacteria bacterium]|nr:hypothetical protein [Deltaproteobacteria bacterium]